MTRLNDISKYLEQDDEVDPEVLSIAKKVAAFFKQCCKKQAPWMQPFNPLVAPEHQTAFAHCIKAAEVIIEIQRTDKVDVESFVQAQFEGLSWAGRVPYLTQLHNAGARVRYASYLAKRQAKKDREVKESDYQTEDFGPEDRKAEKIAARLGVSVKRALKTMPLEFTEAYLRHRGVWEQVREKFNE